MLGLMPIIAASCRASRPILQRPALHRRDRNRAEGGSLSDKSRNGNAAEGGGYQLKSPMEKAAGVAVRLRSAADLHRRKAMR